MSAPVIAVVEAYSSVQYDGANGTDVLAAIPGAALVTDTGTTLTFTVSGNEYPLEAGYWFVWRVAYGNVEAYGLLDPTTYGQKYTPLPS